MISAYTAEDIRAAERPLLEAGQPLMQRAARALADRITKRLRTLEAPHVLVLAGSGANGGDALHAAAILRGEGISVDAIITASTLHEDGAAALRAAEGMIHPLGQLGAKDIGALLAGTDLVLDAIVGIGGRPEIPAELVELLDAVSAAAVPVLAVDLPSFVDATTGRAARGALAAQETVTFGALKAGLLLPGGAELAGRIHLVDLGLEEHLPPTPAVHRLEGGDVCALWPHPGRDATKYSRGVVALAAGSIRFPGAAVLATSGAARTGAGMVRCLAPQEVLDLVLRARPETVGHRTDLVDLEEIGRTHALVVGPGLPGEDPRTHTGVALLASGGELDRGVIDAGGLEAITSQQRFGADVVLTPHRGEADRLAERLGLDAHLSGPGLATALAARTGATVLLKGAITLIAPGDGGPLRSQDDATAQLATAGTGDVLAGVLGTLLAAGLDGPDAAALAAILHGRAGRLASHDGRLPLVALDVADHLPRALGDILADALS